MKCEAREVSEGGVPKRYDERDNRTRNEGVRQNKLFYIYAYVA